MQHNHELYMSKVSQLSAFSDCTANSPEEDEKYIVTDKEGKDSFATYDNYRETLEMIGIPDYSYLLKYELQDKNFASVLENINDISVAGSRDLKISKPKAADALGLHAGQGEDGDGNPGVPSDVSRDEK